MGDFDTKKIIDISLLSQYKVFRFVFHWLHKIININNLWSNNNAVIDVSQDNH